MKKLIALFLITLSATAMAQYPHHNHRSGGYNGWGWVAPAVIGGAVVYAATRPTVVVQQPPIVMQQPPVVVQQPTDIVYIDGIAYRKQLMLVNGAYQEVLIRM
jgi:hypothetical protein